MGDQIKILSKKKLITVILIVVAVGGYFATKKFATHTAGLSSGTSSSSASSAKRGVPTDYVVKPSQHVKHLYYNAIIQPLRVVKVTSPLDGTVKHSDFYFGMEVKKGQLLLSIESQQLSKDYQTALSDYLTKKGSAETDQPKWSGTKALYKLKLISRNEYYQDKQSHDELKLSLLQKKEALLATLKKATPNAEEIMQKLDKLSLHDTKSVIAALNHKLSEWRIVSPAQGKVLFPVGDKDNTTPLASGDPVKKGDVLLTVGDLTGFSLKAEANEVDVLELKAGMPVTITGAAFPGITLNGKIKSVDVEASPGDGGLPMFNVYLVVEKVTPAELKKVLIGMSAQVNVEIKSPPQIRIPMKALIHEGSSYFVMLKKDGSQSKVKVEPDIGSTSLDTVKISKGLKAGDIVVVPH